MSEKDQNLTEVKKKKTSEAQIRASRAWEARNREKNKKDRARRNAKSFVVNYATKEDMLELMRVFEEKENNPPTQDETAPDNA